MYPHERSLVKRLEGKPFSLLGINSDKVEELQQIIRRGQITWRSWAGGSGGGPIAKAWDVHGWPTIYALDAKGVIRYKSIGFDEHALDAVLDQLLEEVARK